eukprot:CAMPEP_0170595554 /NCGR_PEP_ID=MMETSP0224-20130122/14628_1 /TAXON_ID=285029 /ORGANISM="Togula jolla, Strain CCCM 725" /LENGTH=88 /DNA_ID=CAMNT_0010919751 /DNA_START=108 /DNA_END=374 /DNA_ORIENTATION=+
MSTELCATDLGEEVLDESEVVLALAVVVQQQVAKVLRAACLGGLPGKLVHLQTLTTYMHQGVTTPESGLPHLLVIHMKIHVSFAAKLA